MAPAYPIGVQADPPQAQNRLSVLLRIIYAIPHNIITGLLMSVAGIITVLAWFAILFTGKYPEGMQKFVVSALHWQTRYAGYIYLLTDKYPPFALGPDDAYPVRLAAEEQVEGRNRLTVFFRYFMLIPHIIVLYFIGLAACVVILISWFSALFTGNVPEGMHNFLTGALRWGTRVGAYALLLTDQYPPFSLN
jgi:hypothetical protein